VNALIQRTEQRFDRTPCPRGPSARQGSRAARVGRILIGCVLLALGTAGLLLPFLQGVLLIVAGVFVLSRDIPQFRRLRGWIVKRFPRLGQPA